MAQGRGTSMFAGKVAIRRKVSVKLEPFATRISREPARVALTEFRDEFPDWVPH